MTRSWIRVDVELASSDKLARLPNDAARWAWVRVLCAGKGQRRLGIFASRRHLADVIGAGPAVVDRFLEAGLAHVAPASCRCLPTYPDALPGEVVIHDYREEQRAAMTSAERTRRWRDRNVTTPSPRDEHVTSHETSPSRARQMTTTTTTTDGVDDERTKGVPGLRPLATRARATAADAR